MGERRVRMAGREGSGLLIATDNPEEQEDLCAWGRSAGLDARVISVRAFCAGTGVERDVVLRIGLYRPEVLGSLGQWKGRAATLFICEEPWERTCKMLVPDADVDCLCRPFARGELLWRAERALCKLRESGGHPRPWHVQVGAISYDMNLCEVRVGTTVVGFRRAEREIVLYLLRHPDRYVTTAELQDAVLETHGNGGAVRTQIYEIRRKLTRMGVRNTIHSEPRKGYRLLAAGCRR